MGNRPGDMRSLACLRGGFEGALRVGGDCAWDLQRATKYLDSLGKAAYCFHEVTRTPVPDSQKLDGNLCSFCLLSSHVL